MKLIYTQSHGTTIKAGDEVKIGDKVLTRNGDLVQVFHFREPHKPSSSGKISVIPIDAKGNAASACREYSVGVIDAKWIDREDQ